MFEIASGQEFVQCVAEPGFEPRRIRVKAVFGYGSDVGVSGIALVSTLMPSGQEVRLRALRLDALHVTPRNQYGVPRRKGYLRTGVFPWVVRLHGYGDELHAARELPGRGAGSVLVYETACKVVGRWAVASVAQSMFCESCVEMSKL
jgi:hypothetical protein